MAKSRVKNRVLVIEILITLQPPPLNFYFQVMQSYIEVF